MTRRMTGTIARRVVLLAAMVVLSAGPALRAQQALDRVVARVNGVPAMQSDVRVGQALGFAARTGGSPVDAWVERQLLLGEVDRFPPPEPAREAIDREEARLRATLGSTAARVFAETGLDDARLRTMARENLRIEAYLTQRFGTSVLVSEAEVQAYYRNHPDEFMRDGSLLPFNTAEPAARERASTARREATIGQWLSDLRMRADVSLVPAGR